VTERSFLVVGTGGIARKHLAALRAAAPSLRPLVLRASTRPLTAPLDDDVTVVTSMAEALARVPVCAVVAGPATTHVETALPLVQAGVPILIEKPLAERLNGVDALIDVADATGTPVMVGYILRFHPALQRLRAEVQRGGIGRVVAFRAEVGQYLPDWRPTLPVHTSVSAQRALGGGALLELSHEIDYARWTVGDPVAVRADLCRLGDVTVDVEDWVDLHWQTEAGVAVGLHMDMLQRAPVRWCRVIGTEASVEVDLIRGEVWRRGPQGQVEALHPEGGVDRLAAGREEIAALLRMVDGDPSPIPLADGRVVLTIVEAARASAAARGTEVPVCG